jgi:N-acetyl-1-D-myo-inositol-2-amino-2-deoxy-alpha-D-glucopyranoside deacetylase
MNILAFTAHPDDEGSCGGTLAHYAAQGHRCYVVCTTRGNGVDAQIKDPTQATRETLDIARSWEVTRACQKLGLLPPLFLDYQDGEVNKVPLEQAAAKAAMLIRDLKPAIVITHDPLGGYGHPDHIAVSQFVTKAFEMEAPAAKLYYFAFPRSFLEHVPGFRERRADIGGQQLGFVGVPDEEITSVINIEPFMERKGDAMTEHRTQFEIDPATGRVKTFASMIQDEAMRVKFFGVERFVLAKHNLPNYTRAGIETDLFTGITL